MQKQPSDPKRDINWEELWQKISGKKGGAGKLRKRLIFIPVVIIIALWLLSGIYTVGPGEEGVVRQFGKHVSTTGPGLNYHLPGPIQTVDKVNMEEVRTAEIGFRTISSGNFRPIKEEAHMLTGDENIVNAEVVVQYKVREAADYLFNVYDPEQVLHTATEVSLRAVVGSNTIDFVMIDGRSIVQSSIMMQLQQLLDDYNSGLQITAVKLQYAGPPDEVKDAFDEVVRAREDKETLIRESEGYAADRVPRARGEAEQTILIATAYQEQRVLQAEGDATKFLKILKEHEVPAAFLVLANNGITEAAQVLAQIGTIETVISSSPANTSSATPGTTTARLTSLSRETLYEILSGLGVTADIRQAADLTGTNLKAALRSLGLSGAYQQAYDEAIRLTEERLYLETMEDVLPVTEKYVVDPDTGGNLIPFLPLKDLTGSDTSLVESERGTN